MKRGGHVSRLSKVHFFLPIACIVSALALGNTLEEAREVKGLTSGGFEQEEQQHAYDWDRTTTATTAAIAKAEEATQLAVEAAQDAQEKVADQHAKVTAAAAFEKKEVGSLQEKIDAVNTEAKEKVDKLNAETAELEEGKRQTVQAEEALLQAQEDYKRENQQKFSDTRKEVKDARKSAKEMIEAAEKEAEEAKQESKEAIASNKEAADQKFEEETASLDEHLKEQSEEVDQIRTESARTITKATKARVAANIRGNVAEYKLMVANAQTKPLLGTSATPTEAPAPEDPKPAVKPEESQTPKRAK